MLRLATLRSSAEWHLPLSKPATACAPFIPSARSSPFFTRQFTVSNKNRNKSSSSPAHRKQTYVPPVRPTKYEKSVSSSTSSRQFARRPFGQRGNEHMGGESNSNRFRGGSSSQRTQSASEEFIVSRANDMRFMSNILAPRIEQKKVEAEQLAMSRAMQAPFKVAAPELIDTKSTLFTEESLQDRTVDPGDFVEFRRYGRRLNGIFVQAFNPSVGRIKSTSVVAGDTLVEHRTADVVFRIPGYLFSQEAIKSVGTWDVASHPDCPPNGAGRLALNFTDKAMQLMMAKYREFNTVYDHFLLLDQRLITTSDVARYVFSKESGQPLTIQEIYATHLFLTKDDSLHRFMPQVGIRWTGELMLRDPSQVQLIDTVVEWIRSDDKRMISFREKTQRLIESKRVDNKSELTNVSFDFNDRKIIDFIKETAISGYEDLFSSPFMAYLPSILRPMGLYQNIEPRTGFEFLVEIGIWPQWYNLEPHRSAVDLSRMDKDERRLVEDALSHVSTDNAAILNEANTDVSVAAKAQSRPLILQNPEELYKRDPCDEIRHDFGMLPVFAIDDPSASELDDGVSIEPVPITTLTPKASTWVHIHVADPTAVLPPTHRLALMAAERVQSVYLPERTFSMLARSLTEKKLSLNNKGGVQRVMSFSGRIDNETGDILECKVRAGIVRNVMTLNYDDVDEVLNWNTVVGGRKLGRLVADTVSTMPEDVPFEREYYRPTKGSVQESMHGPLLDLQKVASNHFRHRSNHGAFNFQLPKSEIELSPYPLKSLTPDQDRTPTDFSTWREPIIRCRLDRAFTSPARLLVAEYMVMGGRIAAKFTQEQGLPMLYRCQAAPESQYMPLLEKVLQKKDMATGMLSLVDMLPIRQYVQGAEISTEPKLHWSMGAHDGYCKVTSPLRRYSDLVAHWQLKSNLLKQEPVFDTAELVAMSNRIRQQERIHGMLESRSSKFWTAELLRRRQAAGLPLIYEGFVVNMTEDGYNALSTEVGFQLGIKAAVFDREMNVPIDYPLGQKVLFEVTEINPQKPFLFGVHMANMD